MQLTMEKKVELLLDSGISGDKVANITGISKGTFYNIKKGRTDIDKMNFATVKKLANLYDDLYADNGEYNLIKKQDMSNYLEFITVIGKLEFVFNKTFFEEDKQLEIENMIKKIQEEIYLDKKLSTDIYLAYKRILKKYSK